MIDLELQRVHEFQAVSTCVKCGEYEADSWWRRVLRRRIMFRRIWCPGGRTVTPETETQPFVCAGVMEQHLHVLCSSCGYGWLMRTSDFDRLDELIKRAKQQAQWP